MLLTNYVTEHWSGITVLHKCLQTCRQQINEKPQGNNELCPNSIQHDRSIQSASSLFGLFCGEQSTSKRHYRHLLFKIKYLYPISLNVLSSKIKIIPLRTLAQWVQCILSFYLLQKFAVGDKMESSSDNDFVSSHFLKKENIGSIQSLEALRDKESCIFSSRSCNIIPIASKLNTLLALTLGLHIKKKKTNCCDPMDPKQQLAVRLQQRDTHNSLERGWQMRERQKTRDLVCEDLSSATWWDTFKKPLVCSCWYLWCLYFNLSQFQCECTTYYKRTISNMDLGQSYCINSSSLVGLVWDTLLNVSHEKV